MPVALIKTQYIPAYGLTQTHALIALIICQFVAGCGDGTKLVNKTWHEKFGWKAEDYFDDPKVVALCHAIESNDLKEIDRWSPMA